MFIYSAICYTVSSMGLHVPVIPLYITHIRKQTVPKCKNLSQNRFTENPPVCKVIHAQTGSLYTGVHFLSTHGPYWSYIFDIRDL